MIFNVSQQPGGKNLTFTKAKGLANRKRLLHYSRLILNAKYF